MTVRWVKELYYSKTEEPSITPEKQVPPVGRPASIGSKMRNLAPKYTMSSVEKRSLERGNNMPGTAGNIRYNAGQKSGLYHSWYLWYIKPTYGTAEPPFAVGENGYLNVNAAAANSTGGTLDLSRLEP